MVLLGITFSPVEALRRWADEVRLTTELLHDGERRVAMAYGAAATPDQEKAARISVLVGPDRTVLRIWTPADAGAHPAEVLADLAGA